MVRAILREVDPKTMTRRVIKIPKQGRIKPASHYRMGGVSICFDQSGLAEWEILKSPYQVGDHLWVKETWAYYPASLPEENHILYKADIPEGHHNRLTEITKWRSGRFMFKKYSRLWLEVTGVKVERLQDISEEDAVKEGTPINDFFPLNTARIAGLTTVDYFVELWDSINKKHPWESNPWCFAYTFKRIKCP